MRLRGLLDFSILELVAVPNKGGTAMDRLKCAIWTAEKACNCEINDRRLTGGYAEELTVTIRGARLVFDVVGVFVLLTDVAALDVRRCYHPTTNLNIDKYKLNTRTRYNQRPQ